MAESLPQKLGHQVSAFGALPLQRQLGLLASLAMIVAVAVGMVSWGMQPSYQILLPNLGERDKAEAMSALTSSGIANRLDPVSGALMVDAKHVHEARLKLATVGLPHEEGSGFETLNQDTGFGTSRMLENVRLQRALEGELARSVMTLTSVDSARVHLALPARSVFVRERTRPSASVLVNLHPGATLDDVQIAGIVHLVASSVPELEPERVTVVDSRGRLLSGSGGTTAGTAAPSSQLDYTQKIEQSIRDRVRSILAPLVGEDGVRVQVAADVDFTQVESTRESYDDDKPALRSEQVVEERHGGDAVGGVPGSLSNQPPAGATVAAADGTAADLKDIAAAAAAAGGAPAAVNENRSSTRNYEVDRTISHTRNAPAKLDRLSVAVVVDDREVEKDGKQVREPRPPEEIAYLERLVKEAVGFDEARGDRVSLVNASFKQMDETVQPLPEPQLWQQPWVRDLVKQVLAGVGVLALVLLVLRPAMRALSQPVPALAGRGGGRPPAGADQRALVALAGGQEGARDDPRRLDDHLQRARSIATEDPRLVAQVMRQWVGNDE